MVGADGLHMTDAGYGCLAAELAKALAGNWETHRRTAQRSGDTAAKLANMGNAGAVPIFEIGAY
jgi:hypothetical protein